MSLDPCGVVPIHVRRTNEKDESKNIADGQSREKEEAMKRTLVVFILMLATALLAQPASRADAEADLTAKVVAAKTAADHEAIAAEFEQEAKDLEGRAAFHADLAKHYAMNRSGHTEKPRLEKHCEDLSASLKKAAEQAKEMAKLHRELARKAAK
jgi:hypothetical protein